MSRYAFESLLGEREGRQDLPCLVARDAFFAIIVDAAAHDPPCALLHVAGECCELGECSTVETVASALRSNVEGGVCYGMLQVYCSSFRSLVSHQTPVGEHDDICDRRVLHSSMF